MNPGSAFLIAGGMLLLAACAPSSARPRNWSQEGAPPAPDSLRAKIAFTATLPSGAKEDISAVAFAVPGSRYRWEMTGPMGVAVASLLWQEGEWLLVLPRDGALMRGKGDELPLPGTGLPPLDIPLLGEMLWGRLLPPGFEAAESWNHDTVRVLRWPRPQGGFWRAELGVRSGAPLRLLREGSGEEMRFGEFAQYSDRVLPATVEILRGGQTVILMRLREMRTDVKWGSAIWNLYAPEDFRQLPSPP